MSGTSVNRWEALDLLRGLSIIGMLLNLNPGTWDHEYTWMKHVKWEGGHLIDMVAPVFMFCVGAAIPLSLQSRYHKGENTGQIVRHILWRGLALVVLGLFFNAYPGFDFAHLRYPGVLQRIGIAFAAVSLLLLFTARREEGKLLISPKMVAGVTVFVLISYWALLYFVPVPGFGAPRFDPIGSWPAYIDRAVFTVPHMFIYWPVDGKVVFDPDGLLNIYPTCANILIGVMAGLMRGRLKRPIVTAFVAGTVLMGLALLLNGVCPIIKNIWTSTFVLFSSGFALVVLAGFTVITETWKSGRFLFPLRVFGVNPLLAYLVCFLCAPLLGLNWIPAGAAGKVSLSWGSQLLLKGLGDPYLTSFLFSVAYLVVLFFGLWWCYRKRWFLRL